MRPAWDLGENPGLSSRYPPTAAATGGHERLERSGEQLTGHAPPVEEDEGETVAALRQYLRIPREAERRPLRWASRESEEHPRVTEEVICHRCGREGHIAHGCRSRTSAPGTTSRDHQPRFAAIRVVHWKGIMHTNDHALSRLSAPIKCACGNGSPHCRPLATAQPEIVAPVSAAETDRAGQLASLDSNLGLNPAGMEGPAGGDDMR
ncbi:unnamed protein product [Lampetra planeri]